ncbi:40S ribosomal protein S15 [Triticum urartu]|uniref:40S ribosomal protein S15 n=1 Tax=Triticum urartu TaxID=4572 RepID=M7Z8H7_TRIUA|nr:40S ribosomal protein S15 [Triticum urartu]
MERYLAWGPRYYGSRGARPPPNPSRRRPLLFVLQAAPPPSTGPSSSLPFNHGEHLSETLVPRSHISSPFPSDARAVFSSRADVDVAPEVAAAGPKKRTFRKFSYRGVDLDALLDMSSEDLVGLFPARARRRGLKRKPMALVKKLRKAKSEAPAGEKPEQVRTHLRNMIIMPEMIGSVVGIYNGKCFNQVEIKPEMIGHYLAEFSLSYKPVKHGRPG